MELNSYFYTILFLSVALFLVDLLADLANTRSLVKALPGEFRDLVNQETYQKSQQYNKTKTYFEIWAGAFSFLVFLIFWLSGAFNTLDLWVRSFGLSEIKSGLVYFCFLALGNYVLTLPFQLYSVFKIEEHFGFNQQSIQTFVSDQMKSLFLGALLGLPILAFVLWFFSLPNQGAWFWGWMGVTGFSLLLSYVAPKWIMPLFNKFTPLKEGPLQEKIFQMAQKCQFPLVEISVMDGSKRSSKSNAFFTGFGKNKRIALFDTLLEKHSDEELVAILAHEIGHYKLHHIRKHMLFGVLQMGVYFYLIHLFVKNEALQSAFGLENVSVYCGLVFFTILFKPVSKLVSFYSSYSSRVHEYEADAYAAKHTGNPELLISALKKLSKDNLSHFTPHPFYVWMNYSHPPVLERIRALRAKG